MGDGCMSWTLTVLPCESKAGQPCPRSCPPPIVGMPATEPAVDGGGPHEPLAACARVCCQSWSPMSEACGPSLPLSCPGTALELATDASLTPRCQCLE